MKIVSSFAPANHKSDFTVSLDFDLRKKARFIAPISDGREMGFQLPRGRVLEQGNKLLSEDNEVIEVLAADEMVSTVVAEGVLFAKICYHLGNRHVSLQVSSGWCRYLKDHVLDSMVTGLSGEITHHLAPFQPEPGAYHSNHSHE